MYKLECYSTTLSEDEFIEFSVKEIMSKCDYEYGVEVTRETFFAVPAKHLRYIPIDEHRYKCFYFKRKFEVK